MQIDIQKLYKKTGLPRFNEAAKGTVKNDYAQIVKEVFMA